MCRRARKDLADGSSDVAAGLVFAVVCLIVTM